MPLKLTTQAYSKMLLHAAKYPQCAVNGLLVAEKHKRKDGARDAALCVDCVPLFHGPLALAPMLEVALTLVRHSFTCAVSDTVPTSMYSLWTARF